MTANQDNSVVQRLRLKVADAVLPWASAHASVWPSQHATHKVLMETRRKENAQAVYLVGRLDDALREVDPEYVNSPLEADEVRPFLVEADRV